MTFGLLDQLKIIYFSKTTLQFRIFFRIKNAKNIFLWIDGKLNEYKLDILGVSFVTDFR